MTMPRLYINAPLAAELNVTLDKAQSYYLNSVLRKADGAEVIAFNGINGEWSCRLSGGKRAMHLTPLVCLRAQPEAQPSITLAFAPLRNQRLSWLIEKATELGVTTLQPLLTRYTQNRRPTLDRLERIAVEAAEQNERLTVPRVLPLIPFDQWLVQLKVPAFAAICREDRDLLRSQSGDVTLIIGPEGGFEETEKSQLQAHQFITSVSLGKTILRAETAALVGLARITS